MHTRPGNTNPVAVIRKMSMRGQPYRGLMYWCPGCEGGLKGSGLHILPVNVNVDIEGLATWTWDYSLTVPTLSPSILTRYTSKGQSFLCHSYLRNGFLEFLPDSTHSLSGMNVQLQPLPDWVVGEDYAR